MIKAVYLFLIFTSVNLYSQNILTPLELANYSKITSHSEIILFIQSIEKEYDLITSEVIASSVEGKEIFSVYFSNGVFGEDKSKIKLLIFAQQHGNEHSGKEGALLMITNLLKPENRYLFDKIDFALVPQVNPDGAEKDQRRNGNGMDLNRNHLILTEPETIGLHKLFNKYHFEVTMDVHEYYPFGKSAEEYGYIELIDQEIGTLTNINVAEEIRQFSKNLYLPYIERYFKERNFSFFEYCPGGPPGVNYIRHSTFDINDGRQSLGIQNTFSLIQEGLNGEESNLSNIKHRTEGQMAGMMGLIEFVHKHKDEIKDIVSLGRENLISNNVGNNVAIQLEHVADGSVLNVPMYSYSSREDTVITAHDYRPLVKSLFDVKRPSGYLVPNNLLEIVDWLNRHSITYYDYKKSENDKIEQYFISEIDSMDFEGDTIVNPIVQLKEIITSLSDGYQLIPLNQLKNNMIVIALEPKSELGLVTYPGFEHLLNKNKNYPILRVHKSQSE